MTDLPSRLRALVAFEFREPTTDWAKGGKAESARLAPLLSLLPELVGACEKLRASKYPERTGIPEVEAILAKLNEAVKE